ncbi:MAG: 3-phosphoshikimate 1-carboxyvinyltransferase [Anaerolineae bacterium]
MTTLRVHPGGPLHGETRLPGDKSLSHRAVLFGALAEGESRIHGFLPANDCQATVACVRALGVDVVEYDATTLSVRGRGLRGRQPPPVPLDCARSGTTLRLLAGVLAGRPFDSVLTGDPQLLRRPMRRITVPLRAMGARIDDTDGHAPLVIHGGRLHGAEHTLRIASAQVKSALLLAGLTADGATTVHQPGPARDHTERLLQAMGADLTVDGLSVTLRPSPLQPLTFHVPGDLSSAAFLLVAATLLPGSEVTVRGVGLNPTRTGLLDVLTAMGAEITVSPKGKDAGEPLGDLTVQSAALRGAVIEGATVVRMIDEFPALAVAATQATGTTVVREAAELRVKETDRIAVVVDEVRTLGARIEARPDGFVVEGPTRLHGGVVDSHGDHRLAMALTVAGLLADAPVVVRNTACIADSFPGFVDVMTRLGAALASMD